MDYVDGGNLPESGRFTAKPVDLTTRTGRLVRPLKVFFTKTVKARMGKLDRAYRYILAT